MLILLEFKYFTGSSSNIYVHSKDSILVFRLTESDKIINWFTQILFDLHPSPLKDF